MTTKVGVSATVKRGPESWAYIYIALGFVLSIEGTIIGMITPLVFPWNLIAYIARSGTVYIFVIYRERLVSKQVDRPQKLV